MNFPFATLLFVFSAAPLAQYQPIKPIDPSKAISVTARGVGPVPGALLCPDMDTISALFSEYASYFEDALQDRMTGGQSVLVRGASTPNPNPAAWGCALVKPGTKMILEKGNIVPVVRVSLPDGRKIRGVTQANMFEIKDTEHNSTSPQKTQPK